MTFCRPSINVQRDSANRQCKHAIPLLASQACLLQVAQHVPKSPRSACFLDVFSKLRIVAKCLVQALSRNQTINCRQAGSPCHGLLLLRMCHQYPESPIACSAFTVTAGLCSLSAVPSIQPQLSSYALQPFLCQSLRKHDCHSLTIDTALAHAGAVARCV